jgi:hypothetical protein
MTALFLGIFGVGAVGITSGTAVLLYTLRIADHKANKLLGFAENTIQSLPDLMASLPPALNEILSDRRAPEYVGAIGSSVRFVLTESGEGVRPVLTVVNNGSEVVSMLGVRVAAMDANGVPVRDWTEVVATPLPIDDDWRGVLLPGATRHVVLHSSRSLDPTKVASYRGEVELSELRVWVPTDRLPTKTAGL